jgi:hypothetical protein
MERSAWTVRRLRWSALLPDPRAPARRYRENPASIRDANVQHNVTVTSMPFHFPVATVPAPTARQYLNLLRRVAPPSSVVHVGAGSGVAAARLWEEAAVEHLLFVEADPAKARELSAAAATLGWNVACALLGEHDGADADFHLTSNPSADGLVSVDDLRVIWPNLRDIETRAMPERRLEQLLDARDPRAFPTPNWLFVDCLPALPIVKGAGGYLDNLDVVWARVVLGTQTLCIDGTSLAQLTEFLAACGFRLVDVIEGIHPALGDAFFFRDWRGWLEPKLQAMKDRNGHLARRCEQEMELAADRQREIEALTADRTTQAKLADSQDMLSLTPIAQSPQGPRADLEGQLAEFDLRQRRMDEELIRAEAQIDLIKELLFAEPRS